MKSIYKVFLILLLSIILVSCNDSKELDDNLITSVFYNEGNHLIVKYETGRIEDLGSIDVVTNIKIENGDLIVEFALKDNVNLGKFIGNIDINDLIGPKGDKGDSGADGKDGVDGTDGKDGDNGTDGKDGKDGADGSDGLDGLDGKEVEFRKNDTHLQWRYIGDTEWNNLVLLDEIKGNDGHNGENGLTPHIGENGNWFIGDHDTNVPADGIIEMDRIGTDGLIFELRIKDGKLAYYIVDYIGEDDEIIIPNEILGRPVIAIEDNVIPSWVVSLSISNNMTSLPNRIGDLHTFDYNNAKIDTIKQGQFSGMSNLTILKNYENIRVIEKDAFKNTKILHSSFDFSNIEIIGDGAFINAQGGNYHNWLNYNVYLPNEDVVLGKEVFDYQMVIYYAGDNNIVENYNNQDYNTLVNNIKITDDGWWYVEKDDEIILYDYTGLEKEVITPSVIDDKPVTTLGYFSFFGHNHLTRIDFSESIVKNDGLAFVAVRSIYIITIPLTYELVFAAIEPEGIYPLIVREHQFDDLGYDGNNMPYGFRGYHGVTADKIKQNDDFVYYDDGNKIEILTIKNNNETIIVPSKIDNKNVEIISSNAFIDKEGIVKEIIISEGIKQIMPEAFDDGKLEKLYIPSSVNIINHLGIGWFRDLTIYVYAKQKPLNWDSNWTNSSNNVVWDVKDYGDIE